MNELSGLRSGLCFQDVGYSLQEELNLLTIVTRNFRIQLLLNPAYFALLLMLQPHEISSIGFCRNNRPDSEAIY